MPRSLALTSLAVFALAVAGCGSNNKDKIVGKWKATSIPGLPEDVKAMMKGGGGDGGPAVILEFTADGRLIGTMNFLGQTTEVMSAKYTLGSGDWVNLTDLKPAQDGKTKSKDKVVINGDTMTLDTEKGEKITLTRMK